MATQLWSAALIVLSTLFSSVGSFYMKVGSGKLSFRIFSVMKNIPLVAGVGLHIFSALISVVAYRGGNLTVLVPLASLNYIWASILAVRFLGEKMNPWKWMGIIAIMVGISLLGLGDVF
jgi:drug/metabolite transporter (DMT)-like permease